MIVGGVGNAVQLLALVEMQGREVHRLHLLPHELAEHGKGKNM